MRLPTSLAARVGAVVATAAIAVTGATAAADASTTTAASKIPTTLTISVAKPVVHKKFISDVVKGHLTAGTHTFSRLPVYLERQGPKGHWFVIRRELTGRHGNVVFVVRFKKSVTLKLVYRGNRFFHRSTSATVTVS